MSDGLTFTVYGVAATKGSSRAIPYKGKDGKMHATVIHDQGDKLKTWAGQIQSAAVTAMNGRSIVDGPVALALEFALPAPKAILSKQRRGVVIPHVKKPDLDKLTRAVKDALSKIVWRDDSQVDRLSDVNKRYAWPDEQPHVVITVKPHALD